jgi:hypothetical protein
MRQEVLSGVSVYKPQDDKTFKGKEIKNVTISREIDASGEIVPFGTCALTLLFGKNETFEFTESEPIEIYHNNQFEGQYYVTEVKRISQDAWNIQAEDALGLLDNKEFYGGLFHEGNIYTPYGNAKSILEYISTESGVAFDIAPALEDVKLSGYILYTDCRSALQQVCICAGCIAQVTSDKNKPIKVYIPNSSISQELSKRRVLQGNVENTKKEVLSGVKFTRQNKLFDPNHDKQEILFLGGVDNKVGDMVFIDLGGVARNFIFGNVTPIKVTNVSMLIQLNEITDGGTWSVIGYLPSGETQRTYSYTANDKNYKMASFANLTLVPNDASGIDNMLQRWYNNYVNSRDLNAKVVSTVPQSKIRSKYGEYLYGATLYGYYEVESSENNAPINIGDVVIIPTQYQQSFCGIIEKETYNLNSLTIVKSVELKEVNNGIKYLGG